MGALVSLYTEYSIGAECMILPGVNALKKSLAFFRVDQYFDFRVINAENSTLLKCRHFQKKKKKSKCVFKTSPETVGNLSQPQVKIHFTIFWGETQVSKSVSQVKYSDIIECKARLI